MKIFWQQLGKGLVQPFAAVSCSRGYVSLGRSPMLGPASAAAPFTGLTTNEAACDALLVGYWVLIVGSVLAPLVALIAKSLYTFVPRKKRDRRLEVSLADGRILQLKVGRLGADDLRTLLNDLKQLDQQHPGGEPRNGGST